MKTIYVLFVLTFFTSISNLKAQPDYILIKKRWWLGGGCRLSHINEPRSLKKWTFDSTNGTYYRLTSTSGIDGKAKIGKMEQRPQYILLEQGKHEWTIQSVDKPEGDLKKWHLDRKTGTYFRMKNSWGGDCRIR